MAGTTESKLEYLIRSKEDVRLAINRMLVPCPENTPFIEYGPKIKQVDVDLSDATVTSDDLMENVIAYDSKEQRLVGTIPDLGPLNFEPSDEEYIIPYGRTDGGKVNKADITKLAEYEACLRIANSVDNLEDYSNTTATPEDIALGKTAYSNGELITGTSESANYNAIISTTLINGYSNYSRITQNIVYLPDTYTINGNASYMLYNLTNLKRINNITAINVTNAQGMFQNCTSLEEIPMFDASKITNAQSIFDGCRSLTKIPALKFGNGCDFFNAFRYCESLTTFPEVDFSNASRWWFTFHGCKNLQEVPDINLGTMTSISDAFYQCTSLKTCGTFTAPNLTSVYCLFSTCSALVTAPQITSTVLENMYRMFDGCTSLVNVPVYHTENITSDLTSTFRGCTKLSNESLNNILLMCTNMKKYTGTKKLSVMGITSEQATICQGLSNYQAFLDAGWTTGY